TMVTMKKRFGIFLAVLFLAVQTASIWHMAEHGFAEHTHNGHTCEIFLYCDHGKVASAPAADVAADTLFVALTPLPFAVPMLSEERHYSSVPRAPPALA